MILILFALSGLMTAGCQGDSTSSSDPDLQIQGDSNKAIQAAFDGLIADHHGTTESSLGISRQIRRTPNNVQWALENRFVEPFDVGWRHSDRNSNSRVVRIALIDESFDVQAPGLKHAFDVDSGINLLEPGEPLWTAHRNGFHHGNLVASIIANRPFTEVEPLGVLAGDGIEIIPIVAAGGHGPAWRTPRSNPEMILNGLRHAIDARADIINISAGIDVSWTELRELASDPIWNELENAGINVVCAAGNDGRDIDDSPVFPASIPRKNVIAVMGMGPDGKPSRRPVESDRWILGTNYGLNTVSVSAPAELVEVQARSDRPQLANGTSVAAAFVTAALAMNPEMTVRSIPGMEGRCRSEGLIQMPAQH